MRRYNYIASYKQTIANNLVNSNLNHKLLESYILTLTMRNHYVQSKEMTNGNLSIQENVRKKLCQNEQLVGDFSNPANSAI